MHLLPHCQESQQQLPALAGTEYPLYLVLIVGGYMLVLFVERVLFSVHDAAHAHTHTGIVSRVNSHEQLAAAAAAVAGAPAAGGEHEHEHDHGHDHAHGHGSSEPPAPAAGEGTPSGVRTRRQAVAAAAGGALRKPLLGGDAGRGGADELPRGGGGRGHAHGHGHVAVCRHGHEEAAGQGDLRQGIVLLVAMSVHTFLECMALGLMVRAARRGGERAANGRSAGM